MLTLKEQRLLKRYETDLAMPKWKYILVYGLIFGIGMFIITMTSNYIFDKDSIHWDYRLLISFFATVPIGGFLYGWIMRRFTKWYYKKLKSKED